jgi:hypothetical protein
VREYSAEAAGKNEILSDILKKHEGVKTDAALR